MEVLEKPLMLMETEDKTGQKYTDKKLLVKGIKRTALSIPLLVLTTYLFTFAFLNKEVIPMYWILPLALIGMALTIYLIFKGIRLILAAVFQ